MTHQRCRPVVVTVAVVLVVVPLHHRSTSSSASSFRFDVPHRRLVVVVVASRRPRRRRRCAPLSWPGGPHCLCCSPLEPRCPRPRCHSHRYRQMRRVAVAVITRRPVHCPPSSLWWSAQWTVSLLLSPSCKCSYWRKEG
jgi:hypothetical protein